MILHRIVHYSKDDPDFGGDYESIDICDAQGGVVASFGDYYHDKGQEKSDGFIAGVRWAIGKQKLTVKERNIADGQY